MKHDSTPLTLQRHLCGGAVAAVLAIMAPAASAQPAAGGTAARPPAATTDARLRRIEDGLGALEDRLRRAEQPRAAAPERLALALLHLETVVGSGRPWTREWQLILALGGAELLPPLYLEVLGSHASRGLPSVRDLQERFEAIAPAILARAASETDILDRSLTRVRSTFAGIGLVAPVEPGAVDTALGSIRDQLRRGALPAALAEVSSLPDEQQALLAGWIAQLRARVAVEQSMQEAILGLLSGRAREG
jgi:hypothetical protein